jgi:hypothetical protein
MSIEKTTEAARGRWRENAKKAQTTHETQTAFPKSLDRQFVPGDLSTSLPIVTVSLPCHGMNDRSRVCFKGSASLVRAQDQHPKRYQSGPSKPAASSRCT